MAQSTESAIAKSDPFLSQFFFRWISRRLVGPLSSTRITPTQVSIFSLLFAIISGALYLGGTHKYLLLGAGALYVSKLLDHVDGDLARLKSMKSRLGGWIDKHGDVYKVIIPFLTIGIGQYLMTRDMNFLILGFVAALLFLFFITAKLSHQVMTEQYRVTDFKLSGNVHVGWTTPANVMTILLSAANQPYYLLLFFSTFGAMPFAIKLYTSYCSLKQFDAAQKAKSEQKPS